MHICLYVHVQNEQGPYNPTQLGSYFDCIPVGDLTEIEESVGRYFTDVKR